MVSSTFEPGCAGDTMRSRPKGIGRPNSSASSVTRPSALATRRRRHTRPRRGHFRRCRRSPGRSRLNVPRCRRAGPSPLPLRRCQADLRLAPAMPNRAAPCARSRRTTSAGRATPSRPTDPACRICSVVLRSPPMDPRSRGAPRRRFRKEGSYQHVAEAIEDAAAAREDFDGVGALRQRFLCIERSVEGLHVA